MTPRRDPRVHLRAMWKTLMKPTSTINLDFAHDQYLATYRSVERLLAENDARRREIAAALKRLGPPA